VDIRSIIREELRQQSMTQARFGELCDLTPSRVSDYLNGKRDVYAETLARMLDVLGLTIAPKNRRRSRRKAR
jgi:transcriptional regulator with XRE-family HTH domain